MLPLTCPRCRNIGSVPIFWRDTGIERVTLIPPWL